MIHAGELRNLAIFKAPTEAEEDGDTTLDPFIEDFRAWVQIQPLAGTEDVSADQFQTSRTSLVTMRYDARVRARMTMHAKGRRFEILSVLNLDERNREMQLSCRELV